MNTGKSVVLHAINRSTFENSQNPKIPFEQKLIRKCEEYIELTRRQIENEMENLFPQINSSLKQRLIDITTSQDSVEKTFVEEG